MTSDFTLRDVLEGARGYLWFGGILFVFAVIFFGVELLSPDLVIWKGRCVPAAFDGGIAHYTVDGQDYYADNPPLQNQTPRTVTVCFYPGDPTDGYIVHPAAYWIEGGLVVTPFALALVLVGVGLLRSAYRLRNPPPPLPSLRGLGDP